MKKIIAVLALALALTGCGRRELEDRSFPTVLVARTGDLGAREEERQAASSKYIDYGQVKAVLLGREAAEDPASLGEILAYLEEHPVFAGNMLVFVADEGVCGLAERDEKFGLLLEDLAKNQPGGPEERLALKDLLNYLHNGEPSIRVPLLCEKEGEARPGGKIELSQEAAEAVHVPVPRKAKTGQ